MHLAPSQRHRLASNEAVVLSIPVAALRLKPADAAVREACEKEEEEEKGGEELRKEDQQPRAPPLEGPEYFQQATIATAIANLTPTAMMSGKMGGDASADAAGRIDPDHDEHEDCLDAVTAGSAAHKHGGVKAGTALEGERRADFQSDVADEHKGSEPVLHRESRVPLIRHVRQSSSSLSPSASNRVPLTAANGEHIHI